MTGAVSTLENPTALTEVERPHLAALDGLRGLAVLIVFVDHFSGYTDFLDKALGDGYFGVQLFFCLSGFLMAYLYYPHPPTITNIRNFAAARAARVLPLYYFTVFLSIALLYLFPSMENVNIDSIELFLSHLVFIEGIGHLWTIAPELLFYVIFILLWRFLKAEWLVPLCLVFIVYNNTFDDNDWTWRFYTFDFFALGIVVWYLYKSKACRGFFSSNLVFAAFLAAYVIELPGLYRLLFDGELPGKGWQSNLVLATTSILFLSSIYSSWGQKVFGNALMRFFGVVSYSMYLLHYVVVLPGLEYTGLLKPFGDSTFAVFLALLWSILVGAFISWLSYKYIEKPSRRYFRRLLSAPQESRTASLAEPAQEARSKSPQPAE
jgi:peptidoglycan/LPS O-acetylase OafA/YrhL